MEDEERAPVPDVLHKGWTTQDHQQAEVMCTCTCTWQWPMACLQQIAQEVASGPSSYSSRDIKRNAFVAICSEREDENKELPFWLSKVESISPAYESESESSSEDDDFPLAKRAAQAEKVTKRCGRISKVKVKEYRQVSKAIKGEVVKNCAQTYAEAKPAAGSRQKSVFTWVPLTSILYTFPKLTTTKSIPAKDADYIVYTAEIWLKCKDCPTPVGVAKMNSELGFKMVPMT